MGCLVNLFDLLSGSTSTNGVWEYTGYNSNNASGPFNQTPAIIPNVFQNEFSTAGLDQGYYQFTYSPPLGYPCGDPENVNIFIYECSFPDIVYSGNNPLCNLRDPQEDIDIHIPMNFFDNCGSIDRPVRLISEDEIIEGEYERGDFLMTLPQYGAGCENLEGELEFGLLDPVTVQGRDILCEECKEESFKVLYDISPCDCKEYSVLLPSSVHTLHYIVNAGDETYPTSSVNLTDNTQLSNLRNNLISKYSGIHPVNDISDICLKTTNPHWCLNTANPLGCSAQCDNTAHLDNGIFLYRPYANGSRNNTLLKIRCLNNENIDKPVSVSTNAGNFTFTEFEDSCCSSCTLSCTIITFESVLNTIFIQDSGLPGISVHNILPDPITNSDAFIAALTAEFVAVKDTWGLCTMPQISVLGCTGVNERCYCSVQILSNVNLNAIVDNNFDPSNPNTGVAPCECIVYDYWANANSC